ncbi:hypothetical protein MASR1M90_01840 [Desulfovibrionales bacterium]
MTINPFIVKAVLDTYSQQHDTGRRIARFQKYMDRVGQGDFVSISKEAKRRQLVEKVTQEIVDNLIGSGSTNPVVEDIRTQLTQEFGTDMVFRYPSTGEGLQVLKKTDNGVIELTNGEKDRLMQRLWDVALRKVDETML